MEISLTIIQVCQKFGLTNSFVHIAFSVGYAWTIDGKRKTGRPKQTWRRTFKEDLERVGIAQEDAEEVARVRAGWRQLTD